MYNRDEFLNRDAKDSLEHSRREQEERKMAMIREQRARELKQFETQLFYKKSEVERMKYQLERLKREAVVRQTTARKEEQDVQNNQRQLKETETRVHQLEQEIAKTTLDLNDKIEKEKAILAQHQKNLETLEKTKRETSGKKEQEKKTLMQTLSRLLFFKKREEQEFQKANQLFNTTQTQIKGFEQSMKVFSQEAAVVENKIRALRSSSK